jgi:phosphoglucosamine mutase
MAAAVALRGRHGRNMVIIGKDTRLSGYMIESALTSGICSQGMHVTLTGPLPTPGIAYLTRALRVDAGIVISASHNPFEDNGIKFFSSEGHKLPDEVEERIEQLVADDRLGSKRPTGADIGKTYRLDDATGRYIEYVKSTLPRGSTLEGLKVVVDCAHGAAYKVTPWVLRELGAEVVVMNDEPDGTNINADCGSTNMDGLRKAVRTHHAHAGIAHDGDADRTLMCDERGNIVDGDKMLGLWALQFKREGRLTGDAVVSTVMSNLGIEKFLLKHGIAMVRTKVGDRFVTEEMLKGGFVLGGEPSGHLICLECNTTGDGPITALHMLFAMKKEEASLSGLLSGIKLYPQVLINVPVEKRADMKSVPEVMDAIRGAEKSLGTRGRIVVRPSGTEHKIRVMVEAAEGKLAGRCAREIAEVIKKKMV